MVEVRHLHENDDLLARETIAMMVEVLEEDPYSDDLVDNHGRRSPRTLTPGADTIAVGQRLHRIFSVVDVRPGSQLTVSGLPAATRLFGPLAMTWAVEPDADKTRLLAQVTTSASTRRDRLRTELLTWGDLVMMRKQLLTF